MAPRTLCDPILDLPVLTAARLFIAEAESSASNNIAKQWSETFLSKCKDALLRISTACGSRASFDRLMSLHGGHLGSEDLRSLSPSSSLDVFPASSHSNWLFKPSLVEDTESNSPASFRSSSREVSPYLASTPGTVSEFLSSSSLVNTPAAVAQESLSSDFANGFSFEATSYLTSGSLDSSGEFFGMSSYLDHPSPLQLSIENPDSKLLNMELFSGKSANSLKSSSDLFPSPWLSE